MGNSNAAQFATIEYPEQWNSRGFQDNYELLENSVTGEQVQQSYVFTGFARSYQEEMQEYLYRQMQPTNIVRVVFVERVASQNLCTGSDKYRVWTERIPVRLIHLGGLPLQRALAILKEALIGYQALYEFGKRASVTDEMIGFTPEGRVKVWVNTSFGDNRPQSYGAEIRNRPVVLNEFDIVAQIIEAVKEHCVQERFSPKLEERLSKDLTFSEAIRTICWYCREEKIELDESIPTHQFLISKPNTSVTFRASPKETMNSGIVLSSRPDTPRSIQAHQPKTVQNINVAPPQQKVIRKTENSVVNLQSRALQLKQQCSEAGKVKPEPRLQTPRIVEPQSTIRQIRLLSPPRQDHILLQNLSASTNKRYYSEDPKHPHSRIKQVSPSRHLLAHKDQPNLEASRTKREIANVAKNKARIARPLPILPNNPQPTTRPLSTGYRILRNQSTHQVQPTSELNLQRKNQGNFNNNQIQPQFSFDPKYQTHLNFVQSISPIDSLSSSSKRAFYVCHQRQRTIQPHTALNEQSVNSLRQQLQTPVYITHPTRAIGKPTEHSMFVPPTVQNVPMTKTIEGPPIRDQDLEQSMLPDEAKFLQDKIKEIEQQLKHITYLDSQNNTPKQNQEIAVGFDLYNSNNCSSVEDTVLTSKEGPFRNLTSWL